VLDTLDGFMADGHAVIRLDGLRVPESAGAGSVGAGFLYAQVRLAPARLGIACAGSVPRSAPTTSRRLRAAAHCLRQAVGRARGVGFMLADNAMDIHQSQLVIWHTAWVLDQGERGTHESSMAKVICSEAIWRVVDRSMQILGGLGITDDTIVARLFRDVRPFRIYDGP
jgi:acyl-CoA dehydrogenase